MTHTIDANTTNQLLRDALAEQIAADLAARFHHEFAIVEVESLAVCYRPPGAPNGYLDAVLPLLPTVAQRGTPEYVADEDPLAVLALPMRAHREHTFVAVAPFVTRAASDLETPSPELTRLLGCSAEEARRWMERQTVWTANQLQKLACAVAEAVQARARAEQLETEVEKVSHNLASTYEEISLLYGLTQNLRVSSSNAELGQLALDWMLDVVPAEGLAIQHLAPIEGENADRIAPEEPRESQFLTSGNCPLDGDEFSYLVERLQLEHEGGPVVLNRSTTGKPDWQFPRVHEVVVVPITSGETIHGWLAAFNHTGENEFGTVEASLLSSVAAILSIHSDNLDLFHQKTQFVASVVRALTSAIDAKDPYTCGHSDRVARVSVRLAQELGYESDSLNTLYMAGLLHDIGKIGIDDSVLRKPGRLTEAEFEHIKLHPELGHRILADLKQLANVLPVVLHHHEQWDGKGYPHGLRGEAIPLSARIVAVADAFDAMSSDRPYRRGMPLEKVEAIFRDGAGKQWDARVIDAFFTSLDDILDICSQERAQLVLDVQQWM